MPHDCLQRALCKRKCAGNCGEPFLDWSHRILLVAAAAFLCTNFSTTWSEPHRSERFAMVPAVQFVVAKSMVVYFAADCNLNTISNPGVPKLQFSMESRLVALQLDLGRGCCREVRGSSPCLRRSVAQPQQRHVVQRGTWFATRCSCA